MLTVICETPGTLRAEQRERPVRTEGEGSSRRAAEQQAADAALGIIEA